MTPSIVIPLMTARVYAVCTGMGVVGDVIAIGLTSSIATIRNVSQLIPRVLWFGFFVP